MKLLAWVVVASTASLAGTPETAAQTSKVMAELRRGCEGGDASRCLAMGSLADSRYTVIATGYVHVRDVTQARWAYEHALKILEPQCDRGDGAACEAIARVYAGELLDDRVKRLGFLEKGCTAGRASSCFDRVQAEGRSKSAAVPWCAEACRLGSRDGCRLLARLVISSALLDPVDSPPMNGAALRAVLENSASELSAAERAIALSLAQLWAGDRKGALSLLAQVSTDRADLQVFIAYSEMLAADGVDAARVEQAWQRLVKCVSMKGMPLQSDYARADPTALMQRAEAIAARNR